MLVSTKGRYALRVLIDMAEHQSEDYVPLKEIARRQEISEKYLESIVKTLVKGGVLTGLRGKGGGYRLSGPPERYKVRDILHLTEGSLAPIACLEQDAPPCTRSSSCRTRELWQGLQRTIDEYLDRYTVADLMQAEEPGDFYII
ncbi:MAG: Rrf2 family transcriptional regulator [Oscillospiraceae bacterium]|nr:Rrf2 family transcriptional regulator [Oscillospiraceae bacterium]